MKHTTLFIVLLFLYVGIRVNAQAVKDCSVTSFNEVIFEGSARWVLIPSSEEKVVIESKSEDVFDYIDIKQSAGELTINTTDKQKNITLLVQLFKLLIEKNLYSFRLPYLRGLPVHAIYARVTAFEKNVFLSPLTPIKFASLLTGVNLTGQADTHEPTRTRFLQPLAETISATPWPLRDECFCQYPTVLFMQ